ncbi:MAG TPA: ABC-F family ATP-binding cassette domain-containing protein [Polyangiaceae bacterium]|nr:ABC-F family ATP-binding cassette domain-containing protein [Polyangiaceae bacterium]
MSIVAAHGLQKGYGNHIVLRSADLIVEPGERVGVVGLNGAGKSTLGKLLAGVEQPDAGNIARRRGARIEYLEQVPRFDGTLTAEQAVMQGLSAWNEAVARHGAASAALGEAGADHERLLQEQAAAAEEVERLGGWDQLHHVRAVLGHLGVERVDALVGEMSGGEQRRVALARLLVSRPDLAILDEPTNHLDAETVEWLEQHLIDEFPGAVLLITHDRYLLDNVAQRTVEVADGEAFSYEGGYERYLEQKAERQAHAARTEQNRQNFLRRELEWLRRMPKARTTKQKARIERAETARDAPKPKQDKTVTLELDVTRAGKTLLELRELRVDLAGRKLIDGLSLFVVQGDRIGIVGPNGAGKTTLLRAILGQQAPTSGTVSIGKNTKVAYFDQKRSGLDESKSIWDNVTGDQSRIELGGEVIDPRSYLERFAFDSHKQRQPVGSLSGGERARVALARLLRQSANLVLFDEPTNDLDTATLGAVEGMLLDFGVTALIVTHDRYFLDRVATSILAFEGDGLVVHYPGNYDTFRRLRAEAREARKATQKAEAAVALRATAPKSPAKTPGLSKAEERELTALPDKIDAAEQRVSALNAKLGDPATYAGGSDVTALNRELEAARVEAERLTARWEELETKRSAI